jgi:hypothetical protein
MLRHQRLGVHPVIETTPVFRDAQDNASADAAMWREFTELRLVERDGRLDQDLLDTMVILSRPAIEYFGWFTMRGRQYGALVAALGEDAVVAIRGSRAVRISPVLDEPLPETLVQQLPQTRAAHIEAVNIRRAELRSAVGPGARTVRSTVGRDVSVVRHLIASPAAGLGELHVAVRDTLDRRKATAEPIRYRDSRSGRVLVRLADDYVSIAPANPQLLADRLRAAYQELVAR